MKRMVYLPLLLIMLLLSGLAAVAGYGYFLGDAPAGAAGFAAVDVKQLAAADASAQVARGAYLARAGNCMGCHTPRGAPAYAGGRVMSSEFGNFITPNISSDKQTGIGAWTADDFWGALHNGKSKDGRLLYPAFPYSNYTQVTRLDADAMFAYFKTVPAVQRQNQPHALRFPYNQRGLLAFWRALYFRPGEYREDTRQSVAWNRGAYLVNGLGHCSACHSSRNALGANRGSQDFSGGELALINWYAPSLQSAQEASLARWQPAQVQALLKTGIARHAAVSGPMAEVVAGSLQYLSDTDIAAMSQYLQALPQASKAPGDLLDQALEGPPAGKAEMARIMTQGAALYKTHCLDCHGASGRGVASVYPALAGNVSLQMQAVSNPLRMILAGGFPPVTSGNPRPYGMPPFGPVLNDGEVALLLSYIRNAWGNHAALVSASEVNRYRTAPLD